MRAAIVDLDEYRERREQRRDGLRTATGFIVATIVSVVLFWIPLFWWLL